MQKNTKRDREIQRGSEFEVEGCVERVLSKVSVQPPAFSSVPLHNKSFYHHNNSNDNRKNKDLHDTNSNFENSNNSRNQPQNYDTSTKLTFIVASTAEVSQPTHPHT